MNLRILIVEDDNTVSKILVEGLQMVCGQEGCSIEFEVADDCVGVVERHREKSFDLIIVDLLLPSGNGMEVIKKIRETDNVVSFIVITGKPALDTAIEAITQKVFSYMLKPFTLSELILNAQNAVASTILKKKILALADHASSVLKREDRG